MKFLDLIIVFYQYKYINIMIKFMKLGRLSDIYTYTFLYYFCSFLCLKLKNFQIQFGLQNLKTVISLSSLQRAFLCLPHACDIHEHKVDTQIRLWEVLLVKLKRFKVLLVLRKWKSAYVISDLYYYNHHKLFILL